MKDKKSPFVMITLRVLSQRANEVNEEKRAQSQERNKAAVKRGREEITGGVRREKRGEAKRLNKGSSSRTHSNVNRNVSQSTSTSSEFHSEPVLFQTLRPTRNVLSDTSGERSPSSFTGKCEDTIERITPRKKAVVLSRVGISNECAGNTTDGGSCEDEIQSEYMKRNTQWQGRVQLLQIVPNAAERKPFHVHKIVQMH
ncbi:hypothetical protein FGB62_42g24 [Gracilaria domingensis]|nr:hypothetical protein FGB62_42g24 [Gracilaria domingensis]